MSQTIDAVIDTQGQIRLFEKVKLDKKRRAKVIILDDNETSVSDFSPVGSMELLDDDLEAASREIRVSIDESIERSAKELKS